MTVSPLLVRTEVGLEFTDSQGEPVDQYTRGPALDIQITGAQWGVVLTELKPALERMHAGDARLLYVSCADAQVVVRTITTEYFVVLQASPDAHLGKAIAALERAADELEREM